MNETGDLIRRARRAALVTAAVGAVGCSIGLFVDVRQLAASWLVAFMLVAGLALGSLALGMLHQLTGGAWGTLIRRILESAARTSPWLVLLFLPVLLGLGEIYPWSRPDAAVGEELKHLRHVDVFMNVPFFVARAALYLACWIALGLGFSRLSLRADRDGDEKAARRLSALSAGGIILVCLTITFASVDWLMSLQAAWYSTIYGIYVLGGQGISALVLSVLVLAALRRRDPFDGVAHPRHFHDYGNLLLAFVVLWAYFAVSQFLVIWAGNMPSEITFYVLRRGGGWQWVALVLVLFHFFVPFFLLLSRPLKRDLRRLTAVAVLLLVMRWIDLWWQAAPAVHEGRFHFSWLDVAALLAAGGAWTAAFCTELLRHPLLPRRLPELRPSGEEVALDG